jgi:hypothetical protein
MSLINEVNGNPIVWRGHLCEGDQMVPGNPGTFLLWTRCGEHDVPANAGRQGRFEDVHCAKCVEAYQAPKCVRCGEQSGELDFNDYCPTCHDDMGGK